MNRRSFLATSLAAALPAVSSTPKLDSSRVSVITDEASRSPEAAIEFARKFGLQRLSLRSLPAPDNHGKSYHALEPAELKLAAQQFKDAGIRIAFLDTPFLKFALPGTEPVRKTPEEPAARERRLTRDKLQFDNRIADLRKGIAAGQILGCSSLRIFTFSRVSDPASLFPRIAEVISPMADVAKQEGVRLLIENEPSQNAGTSPETAALLKLLPPNVGINWDSLNGIGLGEKPFPDGYNAVPKDRLWNVHVKGKSLLDYPEKLDWIPIFQALERDGFTGSLELETHIFGETQVAASHASMAELLRLLKQFHSA